MASVFIVVTGILTIAVGSVLSIKKGLEAIEFVAGRLQHYVALMKRRVALGEGKRKIHDDKISQQEKMQEVGNAFAVALARLDAAGINETEFPASETSGDFKLSKFTLTLGVWFLLGAKRANARGIGSTVLIAKSLFVLIALFIAAIPLVGGVVYLWEETLPRDPAESAQGPSTETAVRSGAVALHSEDGTSGGASDGGNPGKQVAMRCTGAACDRVAACPNGLCEGHEDCKSCPIDCGQCCMANSYWKETPLSEVVEGVQGNVAPDIRIEVEIREQGAEIELRICKISGTGLFENDAMALTTWYMTYDPGAVALALPKPKIIEIRAKGVRCSAWERLGAASNERDGARIRWRLVSPASSDIDWGPASAGAYECIPDVASTGTCFFGFFDLRRTCKPARI